MAKYKENTPLGRALTRRGWEVRQLADVLSLPIIRVRSHAYGFRNIPFETAVQYARALQVPVSELVGDQ